MRIGTLKGLMQRFHTLIALLAFALVLSGIPANDSVRAQSDLEELGDELDQAEQERSEASSTAETRQAYLDEIARQVDETLLEYRLINDQLEESGANLSLIRYDIEVAEDELAELSSEAQERAVQAYMRSSAVREPSLFLSSSFAQLAVMDDSFRTTSDNNVAVFAGLDERRDELAILRTELEDARGVVFVLRDQLDISNALLQQLFAAADEAVVEAYKNLDKADAEYKAALAAFEEELEKYRWSGDIEQWRPFVEQYFPPERVQEAMRVMACESGGNPLAENDHSTATGLFQFLDGTWAWMSVPAGWGGESRFNPEANIAVAAYLVDYSIRTGHPGGAWGHWECKP